MGKFTPGPWEIQEDDRGCCDIVVAGEVGGLVREIAHSLWIGSDERRANARLIAAAPALLASLREARRWVGDGDMGDGMHRSIWTPAYAALVDQIDAAITLATEES
jgi:hypothetical protein